MEYIASDGKVVPSPVAMKGFIGSTNAESKDAMLKLPEHDIRIYLILNSKFPNMTEITKRKNVPEIFK